MNQRRQYLCFAAKAREAVRVAPECQRQDFQRGVPPRGVSGEIDFAHPTGAQWREDHPRIRDATEVTL